MSERFQPPLERDRERRAELERLQVELREAQAAAASGAVSTPPWLARLEERNARARLSLETATIALTNVEAQHAMLADRLLALRLKQHAAGGGISPNTIGLVVIIGGLLLLFFSLLVRY